MSVIVWGRRVRCDWPGCQAEADVILSDQWPDVQLPEGWTSFQPTLQIIDQFGGRLNEFCPAHSAKRIDALPAVVAMHAKAAT